MDHFRDVVASARLEPDDPALVVALRDILREVLHDRTPVSLLPGLLRSHLRVDEFLCSCGCSEEWSNHVTRIMDRSGMITSAF